MYVAGTFDPSAKASGTFNMQSPSGQNKFLFINESNINTLVKFANGYTAYIPAGDRRLFNLDLPSPIISWSQQSQLGSVGGGFPALTAGISQVTVEVYDPSEDIPETYPSMLVRQLYVGNLWKHHLGANIQYKSVEWTGTVNAVLTLPATKGQIAYLAGFTVTCPALVTAVDAHVFTGGIGPGAGGGAYRYTIPTTGNGLIHTELCVPAVSGFPGEQNTDITLTTQLSASIAKTGSTILYGYYVNEQ